MINMILRTQTKFEKYRHVEINVHILWEDPSLVFKK